MNQHPAALPDRTWALTSGVVGLSAIASYLLLIVVPTSAAVSATLASVFSFGFLVAGVGIHLGVTRDVAPRLGLVAAIANAAAAVELLAMALVQMAVKSAVARPGSAMTGIWLGLDVAWDVFGATGTVLFGLALWRAPRFGPALGLAGILTGGALLVLNLATFPTPPAEAGLFDLGPFVALWYVLLSVRMLMVAWTTPRSGQPSPRVPEGALAS